MTDDQTTTDPAPPVEEPTIRVRHAPDDHHERDTLIGVRLQCLDMATRNPFRFLLSDVEDRRGGREPDVDAQVEHAIAIARRMEAYVRGEQVEAVASVPLPRREPLVEELPAWARALDGPAVADAPVGEWFGGQPVEVDTPSRVEAGAWVWLPEDYRDGFADVWVRPGRVISVSESGWARVDFGGDVVGSAAVDLTLAGGPDERRALPDAPSDAPGDTPAAGGAVDPPLAVEAEAALSEEASR